MLRPIRIAAPVLKFHLRRTMLCILRYTYSGGVVACRNENTGPILFENKR